MGTQGSFGYKIGNKLYLMRVQFDADLLWQILVREIYVLMQHYGSIESLQQAFETLLEAKGKPTKAAIEKCKVFTSTDGMILDWYCLTRHCQHSFINILESGYFLNNGSKQSSFIFILDFNTNSIRFYGVDCKKETEYEKATINEIMEYKDMPTKSYTEIVSEMREKYEKYDKQIKEVDSKIENVNIIIKKAKELGEQNIILEATILLDNMNLQKNEIERKYQMFYCRLDALNLIDNSE